MFGQTRNKELDKIKSNVKSCGTTTILMLESVMKALMDGDVKLCDRVINELEDEVNGFDNIIEKDCIRYLALYSPKAKTLRTVIMYLEINHDLERVGDLCYGIAESIKKLDGNKFDTNVESFKVIFSKTLKMLINVNKCVHNEDVFEAMSVINEDKEINDTYYTTTKKIMETFKESPNHGVEIYELLKMLQRLERIGDHCKNIAEEVVYLVEGKVLRH